MKRNVNQLKAGAILSYIQMAASIIIGLIYTPIMLKLLGKNEYGLYNTVSSTISMLSVLSLGFSSGYIRFYSKYKSEDKETEIARLNGLYILVFCGIGIIALCCGMYLSFNLQIVFDTGLTESEYATAKVLMLLLTFNIAISFPASVFQTIIAANERFIILKGLAALKTIVTPLMTLPLLLLGYRSIAMVSVTVIVSLLVDVAYLIYAKCVLKSKFIIKGIEWNLLRRIATFSAFIALNVIIDQINWNVDKLLLGRYQGTASVAVYAIGFSLYSYYQLLSTSISGVFTPRIHRIINEAADDEPTRNAQLTNLFTRVGRIQYIILALAGSGVVFFGKAFIRYWAGDGYDESYAVALLLILPASIALIQNLGIEIQRAENKHQFRSIAYAIMACFNLIASIFLCQLYGATGAAIGTAAALIIANGFIMNIYYHKRCGINVLYFWKNILRMSCGLIPPIIVGIVMSRMTFFDSFIGLIIGIILYTIVYMISMWTLGINDYEKELFRKMIKKIPIPQRRKKKDGIND